MRYQKTKNSILWTILKILIIALIIWWIMPEEASSTVVIIQKQGYVIVPSQAVPADPEEITKEMVIEEIIRQAEAANFDVKTALYYAECESGYDHEAKNPFSSAKGVYQFINKTWKWIKAEGHQYDYKENIKQFIKWYPIYPQWWEECSK